MAVETLPEPSTRVTPTSRSGFGFLTSGPIITTATICLTIIVVLAIIAPWIVPHDPMLLKPAAADIRAVYAEPLASALIASYEQMYTPDAVIQPKPEHKQLLTTFTTTGHLKAGDPVLDEFPGGYKDVLDYFVADVPIGRFKFVEPGETLGLAFDGLIFVNNRWVFMPKPWRALEQ